MTTLQQWAESDTAPWTKANENDVAFSAAAIFAKRGGGATTGLTWAFYGGLYNGNTITDGAVTLDNSATNYVVVLRSTGVVSTSTSSTNSLNPLYAKLYTLTTAGSVVTVEVDSRWDANGLLFNTSGAAGTVTSVTASGGVQTATGSPITGSDTIRAAAVFNAQTGTTYTVLTGDRGKMLTLSNAGAIAVTLPQAGASFPDGWFSDVQCIGAGTATITPTTSTINGAATLVLTTGQSARIVSDGTNYRALTGGSSGGVSLSAVNVFTKNQSVTPVALSDGATINTDASLSNNFKVTLGGNRTMANPTNLTDGMVLNYRITQDGTGSRTLTWGSKFKWALGGLGSAPLLSTTANSADTIGCYYDSALDVLHCALIGQAGPAGAAGTNGTNGANGSGTPGSVSGRLTLESGVPISTTDQTAKTTVYFTPYKGNSIQLWDGAAWTAYSFTETSLALGTLTSGLNYDVFGYQSAGVLTLEMLAWTNDTTRATAVTLQDGRYCKSGDKTRLLLGTFRTTSTTATEDSSTKRLVSNVYNEAIRPMRKTDSTASWTYASATIRQARASAANQVECVVSVVGPELDLIVLGVQSGTASVTGGVGIGEDSTTAASASAMGSYSGYTGGNFTSSVTARLVKQPAPGYHYYAWLETCSSAATITFSGSDNNAAMNSAGLAGKVYG